MITANDSKFKSQFRYYKSKNPPPDLKTATDPFNSELFLPFVARKLTLDQNELSSMDTSLYLQPTEKWKIVECKEKPGLFVIKDVFDAQAHFGWAKKCLNEYCLPPNVNNVAALQDRKEYIDPLSLRRNLRWSAQGYIYDWTNKVYREADRTPFCPNLYKLSVLIAKYVGFDQFCPDAAIVNHYFQGSVLSGHVDRSEWSLCQPIISISFGQSCVFLAGGPTVNDDVTPILLHNGNILIMSGEQRTIYHGVPRILCDTVFDTVQDDGDNVIEYLNSCRINLSIRQVEPNKNC